MTHPTVPGFGEQQERFEVLVVDDNPGDRLLYRRALGRRAFVVVEASAAQAGLDACRERPPHCILLDYNMPDMNGLEFMAALKREFGNLPCAIVMLTGVQDELVAVRAMKAGATDYIPKTAEVREGLGHSIESAIEKFRMRRQIEEQRAALEASERNYRAIMEGTPQLVWVVGGDGTIAYANRRWLQYTGVDTDAIAAPGPEDVIFPEDRERYRAEWRKAVDCGAEFECELRLRRAADGNYRWHLLHVVPLRDLPGVATRWLATCIDIEDNKQAQHALQHTQKWESIGLLAGGIAHDFNNLLVGILGGAHCIVDELPATHPLHPLAEGIVRSGERAAQLTRQMLDYSGRGQFFVERVDLSNSVSETCDLVRASIPPNVALSIDAAGALPLIETDAAQIQQVIANLVVNAAESIPDGRPGTIVVRTFSCHFSAENLPRHASYANEVKAGSYVVLEVRDSGIGMTPETIARIFDPFFSTKFTGRGLGLAAVQGILRTIQGSIAVESEPGKGSVFRVFIPVPCDAGLPARKRVSPARVGSSTILVIDDEEIVRNMARIALEHAGYNVLLASGGVTGIQVLEEHRATISLVLLDMSMPEMSGKEVLSRIRASRIDVPVAVCSGYSEPEALRHFAGCEFAAFIQKPFRIGDLSERIRRVLAAV